MSGHYLHLGCQDAYSAVVYIVDFLTSSVGWAIVEDVTDAGSVRDVVLVSPGEPEVPNGFPRYIRFQSTADHIFLFTYETFINTSTNTGEVSDVTHGAVYTTSNVRGFELRVVADLERVIINIALYTTSVTYTGYVGRVTSYYRAQDHHYPNIVKGGTAETHDWYSLVNNSWLLGPDGTKQHYHVIEPLAEETLTSVSGSDRNGELTLSALVLVNTDADAQKSELVGEPRGVYHMSRLASETDQFVSIGGEVYVVFVQNDISLAIGPVGVEVPRLITKLTN